MIGNLQVAARSSFYFLRMNTFLTPTLRIGQAAKASGLSAASVRFYEQQGLLGAPVRSANGYRTFSAADVAVLRRISTCRSLDMSLDEVRLMLDAAPAAAAGGAAPNCALTAQVLREHMHHVQSRMHELEALQLRLQNLLAACNPNDGGTCPMQTALDAGAQRQALPARHV